MRKFLMGVALLSCGCLSSIEADRLARTHEAEAQRAAAQRDYRRAAYESHEAERLRAMAEERRFHETATAPVLVPARM